MYVCIYMYSLQDMVEVVSATYYASLDISWS